MAVELLVLNYSMTYLELPRLCKIARDEKAEMNVK